MRFAKPYQALIGKRIRWGMFAGMNYVHRSVGSSLGPKLLGTYEMELAQVVDEICNRGYAKIIDVGAAEGYFAVGFALRSKTSSIVAFESDDGGRRLMAELAAMNGVAQRIEIRGRCGIPELHKEVSSGDDVFLMMDAEGAEASLLDPAQVPALAHTDMLVELHDFIVPGVTSLIKERFSETHAVSEILSRERRLADAPGVIAFASAFIGKQRVLDSMNEGRPAKMSWLHLQSRGSVDA